MLIERAGNLHDEVESWKGIVLGIEKQKKNILTYLQERFKVHPDQEEFAYSEWILGTYTPQNDSRPSGYSLSRPDPNRIDIKYQFIHTMKGLEKDGHFTITNVEINFDAEPTPTKESEDLSKWSLGERSLSFHPAKHCKVTFKLNKPAGQEAIDNKNADLINSTKTQSNQENNSKASFDLKLAKIKFMEKEIPIPRNTDQFELCMVIFNNEGSRKKEWSWDEMSEKWGGNFDEQQGWRKVYNAAREINLKVAAKTTIENLLLVTTRTVQLNSSYF